MNAAPLALLTAIGCAKSVIPLYEAAKADALADPGPAPARWSPDAWMQISAPTLDALLEALVTENAALSTEIDAGLATIRPKLSVAGLTLRAAEGCAGCLTVDLDLGGTVGWSTALGDGSTGLTAGGVFDVAFELQRDGRAWTVLAAPRRLRHIQVTLAGGKFAVPTGPITDWITANLLANVPPMPIAAFPGDDLPLRALAVLPLADGVRVEALTQAPTPIAAPNPPARLADGWMVGISEGSLLAAARAEAFRAGPVAYGVVPEPTALDLGDGRFLLGLRLWRTEGRGWWRDYEIRGSYDVDGRGLHLTPDDVTEIAQSSGAIFADPLAALAEGRILESIEDAFAIALPVEGTAAVGAVPTTVTVSSIRPDGPGGIRAQGSLQVGKGDAGERKGRRR
jgi:hypothetical protein